MYSTQHRFSLDPSSKKFLCPSCNRKRFVRYRDSEENQYLPDYVGRCDREQSCGYHYTPKQFVKDNPDFLKGIVEDWRKPYIPKPKVLPKPKPPIINYIPPPLMKVTFKRYEENHFVRYLESLFEQQLTQQLIERFHIGTAKRWRGATAFWQVDINGNVRQAKTMLYNPNTGKRVKEHQPPQIGRSKIYFEGKGILRKQGIKEPNLSQCFFGEHQLNKEPDKIVAIVESEKTAILMTTILPKYLWLATGGKNGCKWKDIDVIKPLNRRKIVLHPDLGCLEDWSKKADQLRKMGFNIVVSDFLEKRTNQAEKSEGFDLADYFIKRDKVFGWALSEGGYPLFLDDITQLLQGKKQCIKR